MEEKIGQDIAESEFNRFLEQMDIDGDTASMKEDDSDAFLKQKGKIIRALCRGNLVIESETGEAVYTPINPQSKHKEPLTFHQRSGASLMAIDGHKNNQDVRKTYAVMADMCKVNRNIFAGLVGTDIKTCEALFALLMD